MTKASDNPFPSLLVVEGGAPTSPGSGDQRLFIDSADHKLKRVNSSGTVTTVEGGGGTLAGDSDVAISSPASGQALIYNGTDWANAVPPGTELGYAQITAAVSLAANATFQDVTGLSVTVTVPSSGCIIEAMLSNVSASSGSVTDYWLKVYDITASANIQSVHRAVGTGGDGNLIRARHVPGAGSRQYKLQFNGNGGGTATQNVNGGSLIGYIRVTAI